MSEARPDPYIVIEPARGPVRAYFAGEVVVDSANALVLREGRYPPVLYIPKADVRWQATQPSERSSYCPHKGTAQYWHLSAGGQQAENAVWAYPEAIDDVAQIRDCVALYWDKLDRWEMAGEELKEPAF